MSRLLRKKAGFTLIELMIVVAIIGILAAIALPAFLGYVRRSKTSEATNNLKSLYVGATQYYDQERTTQGIAAMTSGSCRVTMTGPMPALASIGTDKTTTNFATDMSFGDLGFTIADPHYFAYAIDAVAGCGGVGSAGGPAAGSAVYSFRAQGDLDGDMAYSLFELAVGVNASNQLFRSPGFYVTNELE